MSKKPKRPKPGQPRGAKRKPQQNPQGPKPAGKPPQKRAPAAANHTTNGAKCNCPAATRHPCDVTSLELSVIPRKKADSTDAPDPVKVTVTKPLRSPDLRETVRLKKLFGRERALLLQQYDVIIETVASFSHPPETTIDVHATGTWEGTCPTHLHPRLHMRPRTSPGTQRVKVTPPAPGRGAELVPTHVDFPVGTKKITLENLHALPTPADLFMGQDALTVFFKLLFFVMSMNSSVDVEFWADSEGVPVNPARTPNKHLNGLLRVFRDVQVGVAVTIPRGVKVTEELKPGQRLDHMKRGVALDGTRTEKDYRSGSKHTQERNDHGWSFGSLESMPKGQYALVLKLNDFEITLKEEDKSWAETKKAVYDENKRRASAAASRVKGGAQRAAMEAKLAWHLRDFMHIADYLHVAWQHLVQGIKAIRSGMAALIQVFKKAPQLGFKFEYEFTFFSVGASVTASRKPTSALVEKRIVPLKMNGKLEVKLTVIDVKATLSFGLLIDLVALRLEARVYGQIGGAVEAKIECSLLDDAKAGLEGKATGKLGAVFQARALWKVIHKEIAIETGFVTEGGFTWKGKEKQIGWEFKMRSLPVQWYVTATNERTGQVQPKYHTLCEPRTLYAKSGGWSIR